MSHHPLPDPGLVERRLVRARRELPRIRRPDTLLARLLELEIGLGLLDRFRLRHAAACCARAFDPRVVALLGTCLDALGDLARNPHLDAVSVEWLAVSLVSRMDPPASTTDYRISDLRRKAFNVLIERHGLRSGSLAGAILFREAWANLGAHTVLSKNALVWYLEFPDVSGPALSHLAQWWRNDAWGTAQVRGYRPRAV